MTRPHRTAALVALSMLLAAGAAAAQDRSPGLLDNLFGGQRQQQEPQQEAPRAQPPRGSQGLGGGDDASRVDRIESALRQLTGTIEQLQHDNQMLQMQLKRLQDDTEYRFQQMGQRGPTAAPGPAPMAPPVGSPPQGGQGNQGANGRRSDVFDPSRNPNAVGAPRTLGNASASAMPSSQNPPIMNAPQAGAPAGAPVGAQVGAQVGAPGGRDAGAPLDLSALAGNPPDAPPVTAGGVPVAAPQPAAVAPQGGQLPPVMAPRNTGAAGTQLATLPPSASPKDEYDLAYGYVLRKDYALAAQTFGDFMVKHPNDKMLPNAQYWLGESQYQQQRYREAAESFLAVSTKYERAGKAPEALLRLGQSLAALHQKEASCATLAEVGRKYPKASPAVKRDVAQEQKRGHC
jgi:tol-pal system protein YbgF